jgi:hypothetical protein
MKVGIKSFDVAMEVKQKGVELEVRGSGWLRVPRRLLRDHDRTGLVPV